MPKPLHFVGFVLALTSLAACERKSPTTSLPTAAPQAASPDTTHLVALSTQDSTLTAGPAVAPEALPPDSVLEVKGSKLVTPGLTVAIKGTYVTDNSKIQPKRILIIKQRERIIYTDTTADFLYEKPFNSTIYPLWVPTGKGAGELLIEAQSPPDLGVARRFFIQKGQVTKVDTLPVFEEKARNLDKDPRPEFGGYRYSGEQWDDGRGHYFTSYNPKLYYEVRPTGLVLDTVLTKRKAIAQYGVFRGFEYSDKPGIRVKQRH